MTEFTMSEATLVADAALVPEAIDAAVGPTAQDVQPHRWPPLLRLGFRYAFCYFALYCLCCGNATIWEVIPVVGGYPEDWFAKPFRLLAQYLAQHLFHVQGVGSHLHGTGSGDTAIDWIVFAEFLVISLVASLIWTALDRKRPHYQTLSAWLRFLIRLTLGVAMLGYGFAKFFPLQMAPPLLPVLNEPLGNLSPMTMLWTLIGLNPIYEMVCGGAEIAAGLLILFRRTALAGALLTAFVVANVVLYNFFFDVPVKIYAAHLLAMALFVTLPDVGPLYRFFWQHQLAAPLGIWVPPAKRKWFRRATAIVEAAVLLLALGTTVYGIGTYWRKVSTASHAYSPLRGAWHLDTATLNGQPKSWVVGLDQTATELWIENPMQANLRSADGALWRAGMENDDKKHTLAIYANGADPVTYAIAMPDNNHLILTPTDKQKAKAPTLTLTRIPLPDSYPLLTRGFHFVNEWGLER